MTTHSNYNDIPYKSLCFAHCQPERLHALAKMKGLNPADLEHAKVLEIGCSFGGNLIPFAIRHPNSTVIGIDLSETQIATGQQMMQEIGLDNVHLIAADISKVSFENCKFDYIICHGVFSWVPRFVQDAILKLIQTYLAPQGVAFVSYNAYPGWHTKETVKALMNFGTDAALHPFERIDLLPSLFSETSKLLTRSRPEFQDTFETYSKLVLDSKKYYVSHEYFEDCNYPFWFGDFVAKLEQHNLAYLTDSSIPSIKAANVFSTEYDNVAQRMGNDVVKMEQYMDILINRTFRTSLITHPENVAGRTVADYEKFFGFNQAYLHGKFEQITNEKGEPRWNVKGVNFHYAATPEMELIAEMLNASLVPVSTQTIVNAAKEKGLEEKETIQTLIGLAHYEQMHVCFKEESLGKIGKRPKLNPKYARLIQFVRQNPNITNCSNMYASSISIGLFSESLAPLLDGTRTHKALLAEMRKRFDSGELVYNIDKKPVAAESISDKNLKALLDNALQCFYEYGYFREELDD